MGLRTQHTVQLDRFGYRGVTVDVDAEFKIKSIEFPNPLTQAFRIVLTPVVGGNVSDEPLIIDVSESSEHTLEAVAARPVTAAPATVNTLGELIALVQQEVYHTIKALNAKFTDATVVA